MVVGVSSISPYEADR